MAKESIFVSIFFYVKEIMIWSTTFDHVILEQRSVIRIYYILHKNSSISMGGQYCVVTSVLSQIQTDYTITDVIEPNLVNRSLRSGILWPN